MGFFTDTCKECKTAERVQMCQYCKKMVCITCLNRLVYREDTPPWFFEKIVTDFNEYEKLNKEYCKLIRTKGGNIHCCGAYLLEAWNNILKQVKRLETDRGEKAVKIILK